MRLDCGMVGVVAGALLVSNNLDLEKTVDTTLGGETNDIKMPRG